MTTLNSTTNTTTDSGYNPGQATASVVVSQGQVLGATNVSTGLTNNPMVDSFFIPLVIAIVGVWVYKSGILGISEWIDSRKGKHQDYVAGKQLKAKIQQIQGQEKA